MFSTRVDGEVYNYGSCFICKATSKEFNDSSKIKSGDPPNLHYVPSTSRRFFNVQVPFRIIGRHQKLTVGFPIVLQVVSSDHNIDTDKFPEFR